MFKEKGLKIILLIFLILAILTALMVGSFYYSSSVFIAFLFLLALGSLSTKGHTRELFLLSFFINLIISGFLNFYFLHANGIPFNEGGDEKTYYDFALNIYRNGIGALGEIYWLIPYKAYVLLMAMWMRLLSFIGMADPTIPFNLRILNDFVGAWIPVLCYRIFSYYLNKSKSLKYALCVLFFPLTIFYSATLFREVYVTVPFLLVILITISGRFKKLTKVILVCALVIFTYFIRPASAIFILSFPALYIFFKKDSDHKLGHLKKIIIPILFVALILIIHRFNSRSIDKTLSGYVELSTSTASGNSVGKLLVSSHNPLAKIVMPIYIAYSPIPPPVFLEVNLFNIFISIGSIWWYIVLPFYILLFFKLLRKKDEFSRFTKASGATFLFSLLLVSITSMDPRHIQFIYPIVLFGGIFYYKNYHLNFKRIIPGYLIVFTILISSYLLLKGL